MARMGWMRLDALPINFSTVASPQYMHDPFFVSFTKAVAKLLELGTC
jgi:hypothetical protein